MKPVLALALLLVESTAFIYVVTLAWLSAVWTVPPSDVAVRWGRVAGLRLLRGTARALAFGAGLSLLNAWTVPYLVPEYARPAELGGIGAGIVVFLAVLAGVFQLLVTKPSSADPRTSGSSSGPR